MATVKTFIKDGFRYFQCAEEESCLRLSFLIKDAGYGLKMSSNWVKKYTEFKILAVEKDPMEDPKVIKGARSLRINFKEVQGKKASASEILRSLEMRIARLENQRTAGYPQGYFDSDMYDAERSYYKDDSKVFKDDYFEVEEEEKETTQLYGELYDEVVGIMKILSSLHKLNTNSNVAKSFDKTFPKYVKFDPRRKEFKLSGGDYQRVLQSGTLLDGYEDPHFMLTLENASIDRKGDLRWTIGCHMRFMSNEIVSHYIHKGDNYRNELKRWLDL